MKRPSYTALVAGTILVGCLHIPSLSHANEPKQAKTELATQLKELSAEIEGMVTDLSCDKDTQCKSFGYGHRPCGGYSSYKIYSTKSTNEQEILEKASIHYDLAVKYERQHPLGLSSICVEETPPRATCVKGQCTTPDLRLR